MAEFFSNLFGKRKSPYQIADVYTGLRKQIFDLSLKGQDERKQLGAKDRIAILMETGMEDTCYSLVAVSDGSASLYFSNGGGIIGAGQHPQGAEAAKSFLEFSRQFDNQLTKTTEYPLPMPGMTRFYVIKTGIVLSGEFKEDDLGNQKLPLSPLFHKGHELITVVRLIDETRRSESPLIVAVMDNSADTVRAIIKKGIDPNTRNKKGIPALALAVSYKEDEIATVLLAAGANPNEMVTDEDNNIRMSPILNFAAANGSIRIVEKLIASGAKKEASDASGLTPLMSASYMGNTDIVELLTKAGSPLEQRDKSGYTALIFASNAGHVKCVETLLRSGADVNAKDNDGSVPIMFAAQHGYNDIVQLLLSRGANPNLKGAHGLSAIGFAQQNKHRDTELILNQKWN